MNESVNQSINQSVNKVLYSANTNSPWTEQNLLAPRSDPAGTTLPAASGCLAAQRHLASAALGAGLAQRLVSSGCRKSPSILVTPFAKSRRTLLSILGFHLARSPTLVVRAPEGVSHLGPQSWLYPAAPRASRPWTAARAELNCRRVPSSPRSFPLRTPLALLDLSGRLETGFKKPLGKPERATDPENLLLLGWVGQVVGYLFKRRKKGL